MEARLTIFMIPLNVLEFKGIEYTHTYIHIHTHT